MGEKGSNCLGGLGYSGWDAGTFFKAGFKGLEARLANFEPIAGEILRYWAIRSEPTAQVSAIAPNIQRGTCPSRCVIGTVSRAGSASEAIAEAVRLEDALGLNKQPTATRETRKMDVQTPLQKTIGRVFKT